ncbi:MAG: SUMF1/EgtB/PvdO family nonheme iron enzyme, partial [Phycisphaerales bacterium]
GSDFVPVPGYENHGIAPSWRGAALYANWLHHGQTSDPEKLLIGAYDATTFGQDANGTPTDQYEKLPGARFWIPSQDEYIKAAYYDPNRYGDGEGGYWTYPDASDTPLLPGLPEEGGETNAFNWGFNNYDLPIGSYADVRSAYGLLDASGMLHEWTSTEAATGRRLLGTSSVGGTDYILTLVNDQVGFAITQTATPGSSAGGFRMATLIPTPASIVALGFLPLVICVRRR